MADTPHAAQRHGTAVLRGLSDVTRSVSHAGRFGRMFRELPPCVDPAAPEDEQNDDLAQLARVMSEPADAGDSADNADIPAGYTYLGQFIDHDITFDPTSKLQRENDPDALQNFRTPRFDLDSLYGPGPDAAPYLYRDDGVHLLVGQAADGTDDVPRNTPAPGEPRRALVGDPRNDENIIVSQLHLGFLKFHNAVVDALDDTPDRFDEACRIVRWHYQWLVVNDFLRRVVRDAVVDDVLRPDGGSYTVAVHGAGKPAALPQLGLRFYHYKKLPFMPVEFSVAAYRFGHSMVRPAYDLNEVVGQRPVFSVDGDTDPLADLRGFRERPGEWDIEWRRFFPFGADPDLQHSRQIDGRLSPGLMRLPAGLDSAHRSLAARNLRRAKALGLPSGQAVAGAMGLPPELVLTGDVLGLPDALTTRFGDSTPLWYYVLKEAEVLGDGTALGPVGGRIVAEVLVGILAADPLSYLNVAPGWQPAAGEFGAGPGGVFSMVELLRFARAGRNPTPTPTTTTTTTPGPGPGPGPAVLHVGGRASVDGTHVHLRANPGVHATILVDSLPQGAPAGLTGGPQDADGHTWWRCHVVGTDGWVAGEFLRPA